MIFNEEFFKSLPNEPILAGLKMCETFFEFRNKTSGSEKKYYIDYLDAFTAMEMFVKANELSPLVGNIPKLKEGETAENFKSIINFYALVSQHLSKENEKLIESNTLESGRNKYKGIFEKGFGYKFTDGDLQRIQVLINELRDLVTQSELFDANHRERLLNKLEGFQKELHKNMSSMDKFYAWVIDTSIVLKIVGNNAKPFMDRVKEIADIVWKAIIITEGLPSGIPMTLLKTENE